MLTYEESIRKAFNEWSDTYEDEVIQKLALRGYSYDELALKIAQYINLLNNKKVSVLELGVGTGVLGEKVAPLIDKEYILNGIDISEKMLEKAQAKNIYSNLSCCSVEDFEFEKGLDFVYSAFMFHSIIKQEQLINKIYKSLTFKGVFALVDLIPNPLVLDKQHNHVLHSMKHEQGAPSNYKSHKKMIDMINNSQFELVCVDKLGIDKDYNHFLYVVQKVERI